MKNAKEALKHLEDIEGSLKDDILLSFDKGYKLGSAVLYIREYLEELTQKGEWSTMNAKIYFDPREPMKRAVHHDFTLKENRDFLRDLIGTEDAIMEELANVPEENRRTLKVMFTVYFNHVKKHLLDPYIAVLEQETATNAATLEAVKSTIKNHQDDNRNHE